MFAIVKQAVDVDFFDRTHHNTEHWHNKKLVIVNGKKTELTFKIHHSSVLGFCHECYCCWQKKNWWGKTVFWPFFVRKTVKVLVLSELTHFHRQFGRKICATIVILCGFTHSSTLHCFFVDVLYVMLYKVAYLWKTTESKLLNHDIIWTSNI